MKILTPRTWLYSFIFYSPPEVAFRGREADLYWMTILYLKELDNALSLKGEKLHWVGLLYERGHAILYAFSENVCMNNCIIPRQHSRIVLCVRVELGDFLKETSLNVAFFSKFDFDRKI